MLMRLLLVVLMLAGPVPVRLCNCAVSAAPPSSSVQVLSETPAPAKSCSCGHRAKSSAPAAAGPAAEHHAEGCAALKADLPVPGGHDSECPAAKPRASMSDAVVTPATDAPAEDGFVYPVDEAPADLAERPRAAARASHARPSVPLFIAFLNLRN